MTTSCLVQPTSIRSVPSDWSVRRVDTFAKKVGSGATPRGGKSVYLSSRVSHALIRSQHVFDRRFERAGLAFISKEHSNELKNAEVCSGDVLLNITGDGVTFARACLVPDEALPACVNQHVSIIRVDQNICVPGYLLAFLTHPLTKRYIESFNTGGSRRAITKGHIESFEVPLPPLPVQRRIAGILSAYDDLIENNQRRIKILEKMARSLYREWFVHFRFPGHEKVKMIPSPLGPIPEGWEVKAVKEVLARRPAGRIYRENDVESEGTVPVIDQSTTELLGFHNNEPDHLATPENPIAIFGDHTCKMQLLVEPFSIGPNVVAFGAKVDRPISYLYHIVRSLIQTQEYKRHWTQLSAKEIVLADKSTPERFAVSIQPSLQLAEALRKANRVLRRTRDLVLPRLLSGSLKIADASVTDKVNIINC